MLERVCKWKLAAIVLLVLLVISSVVSYLIGRHQGSAPPPRSTVIVQGDIRCAEADIVGIWVDAETGIDAEAGFEARGNGVYHYAYKVAEGAKYRLHVGCGRGPDGKWITMFSDLLSPNKSYDLWCYDDRDKRQNVCKEERPPS